MGRGDELVAQRVNTSWLRICCTFEMSEIGRQDQSALGRPVRCDLFVSAFLSALVFKLRDAHMVKIFKPKLKELLEKAKELQNVEYNN